ncbi:MAG: 2-C-methyl-D-erythritol 2,4-cyclodiphosphate synthase [Candidatus Omnitrophica bacterium]|nr:2-C-methyl-D-erythritol 2,4-cyclodiphosphate synthase [Candidatus Omnitrophota bacterium]MBI2495716.1 2-C-methyl-D-erythritol 2,4-cyclodiphosphate synthase [Candidatus Omnitrophota bacterium]MBI3021242.1 2-C-methyl-D-erythritol 2,4-cyclodiphosphate synthase [Candidatus Omnitrophota bacterium]MBI3083970.1 2-C-methyl-D-erythritol 2,4-cyclodiphosphate synthase [Candidatus Omnitrophota bacterium]
MRVGIGYDVHRFNGPPARGARAGKRPLKLGGVTIPFPRGLSGHSDADVLLHAVADALLGAIGAPDLGEQFPSGDPRYRNADSRTFVQAASAALRREGWAVGNVDATVIADAPQLTGYKEGMRRAISRLLKIRPSQVSVKAKTTERFAPGRAGIAAQAVVLLKKARGSGLGVRGKRATHAPNPQPRTPNRRYVS